MSEERGWYQISKAFDFSASHQLPLVPHGHQCKRLHGHNYRVVVTVKAPQTDGKGFVMDYGEMKDAFGNWIKENLDHRHLNDRMHNPTAELLAEKLYDIFQGFLTTTQRINRVQLVSVEVRETPETAAVFYG